MTISRKYYPHLKGGNKWICPAYSPADSDLTEFTIEANKAYFKPFVFERPISFDGIGFATHFADNIKSGKIGFYTANQYGLPYKKIDVPEVSWNTASNTGTGMEKQLHYPTEFFFKSGLYWAYILPTTTVGIYGVNESAEWIPNQGLRNKNSILYDTASGTLGVMPPELAPSDFTVRAERLNPFIALRVTATAKKMKDEDV